MRNQTASCIAKLPRRVSRQRSSSAAYLKIPRLKRVQKKIENKISRSMEFAQILSVIDILTYTKVLLPTGKYSRSDPIGYRYIF